MGKYQWYIWDLCGFGYMLDLLWTQAFGLVLGPLRQEFGFDGNTTLNMLSNACNDNKRWSDWQSFYIFLLRTYSW